MAPRETKRFKFDEAADQSHAETSSPGQISTEEDLLGLDVLVHLAPCLQYKSMHRGPSLCIC